MRTASPDDFHSESGQYALPCPEPSAAAVEAGVFGVDEEGPVVPNMDDVRAITEEHARELRSLLLERDHLLHCSRHGIDPYSGKAPRSGARREELVKRLAREAEKVERHYDDALAAYADGFGEEEAEALGRFVKESFPDASTEPPSFVSKKCSKWGAELAELALTCAPPYAELAAQLAGRRDTPAAPPAAHGCR